MSANENGAQSADKDVTCPLCHAAAYICNDMHTDGSGPTLHCRAASLHNFPILPEGGAA